MYSHEVVVECDCCGKVEREEVDQGESFEPFNEIYENVLIRDIMPGMDESHDICDECIGEPIPSEETVVVGTSDLTGRAYVVTIVNNSVEDGVTTFPKHESPNEYMGLFDCVDRINGLDPEEQSGKFSMEIDGEIVAEAENGWTYPKNIPLNVVDRIDYRQGWPDTDSGSDDS